VVKEVTATLGVMRGSSSVWPSFVVGNKDSVTSEGRLESSIPLTTIDEDMFRVGGTKCEDFPVVEVRSLWSYLTRSLRTLPAVDIHSPRPLRIISGDRGRPGSATTATVSSVGGGRRQSLAFSSLSRCGRRTSPYLFSPEYADVSRRRRKRHTLAGSVSANLAALLPLFLCKRTCLFRQQSRNHLGIAYRRHRLRHPLPSHRAPFLDGFLLSE